MTSDLLDELSELEGHSFKYSPTFLNTHTTLTYMDQFIVRLGPFIRYVENKKKHYHQPYP